MFLSIDWQQLGNDPDNWLEIPAFGVRPKDVGSEGFSFPILLPANKNWASRHCIFKAVQAVRTQARNKNVSLALLQALHVDLLQDCVQSGSWRTDRWTNEQILAFRYESFITDIKLAIVPSTARFDPFCHLACALGWAVEILTDKPFDHTSISAVRRQIAELGAKKRHASSNEARGWVRSEWVTNSDHYRSKADFARVYVSLIRQRFNTPTGDPLSITEKTIREVWLKDTPVTCKTAV